jgi:hypothetical protein
MRSDLRNEEAAASAPPSRVNLDEDWSVDYWKTTLGVAREELIDAVRHVGGDVKRISEYLAKRSAAGPSS